jgi:hypothetical protein
VTTVGAAIVEVVEAGSGLGSLCVADAEGLPEAAGQDGYAWGSVGSCPGHGLADAVGDTDVDGETEELVVLAGAEVVASEGEAEVGVSEGEAEVGVVVSEGLAVSDGVVVSVGLPLSVGEVV